MTRKEIYDSLDQDLRVAFLLGAMLHDEATDRGAKLLTVEAVEKLNYTEVAALNVFLLELTAAEPGPLPENLKAALKAIGDDLRRRRPDLIPSFHGKECPGNGEHPGIERQCDECDHMMICWPTPEQDSIENA